MMGAEGYMRSTLHALQTYGTQQENYRYAMHADGIVEFCRLFVALWAYGISLWG